MSATPEEQQIFDVHENPKLILDIKNPSEDLMKMAFRLKPSLAQHYDNLSIDIQTAIVKHDQANIRYIKNPSEIAQKIAISRHPTYIQFIENPTDDIIFNAVTRHPNSIKYIKHIPDNIILEILKDDPYSIQVYVKNYPIKPELIKKAIQEELFILTTIHSLENIDLNDMKHQIIKYILQLMASSVTNENEDAVKVAQCLTLNGYKWPELNTIYNSMMVDKK